MLDTTRLVAYAVAITLAFVWTQWKRSSSQRTRTLGVAVILFTFVVFSLLSR